MLKDRHYKITRVLKNKKTDKTVQMQLAADLATLETLLGVLRISKTTLARKFPEFEVSNKRRSEIEASAENEKHLDLDTDDNNNAVYNMNNKSVERKIESDNFTEQVDKEKDFQEDKELIYSDYFTKLAAAALISGKPPWVVGEFSWQFCLFWEMIVSVCW